MCVRVCVCACVCARVCASHAHAHDRTPCWAAQALEAGTRVVTQMCTQLESWGAVVAAAKTKRMHQLVLPPAGLQERVEGLVWGMLQDVYRYVCRM